MKSAEEREEKKRRTDFGCSLYHQLENETRKSKDR